MARTVVKVVQQGIRWYLLGTTLLLTTIQVEISLPQTTVTLEIKRRGLSNQENWRNNGKKRVDGFLFPPCGVIEGLVSSTYHFFVE